MIRKEVIDFVSEKTDIKSKEFIEKDLILHRILLELSNIPEFSENYAFKGGTCLIKCYLGYYRFSEDLDFTYLHQREFEGKSMNQMRKLISNKISKVAELLEKIAKLLDLRFKADKQDKEHFQFGGSNAFVTFKLWYKSSESERENFIKVQINYIEKLNYAVKELKANSLITKNFEKEFSSLFPEESKFLKPIKIRAYDIKEVLIEKIRAVLTRRGVKARDFIDIYKITKSENLKLEDFKKGISNKIGAMLKFEKYQANLDQKQQTNFAVDIDKEKIISEEEKILLIPIPEDFVEFLSGFKIFLNEIIREIKF
jgi:predicted nucleotidyltransferase component of viral defense system